MHRILAVALLIGVSAPLCAQTAEDQAAASDQASQKKTEAAPRKTAKKKSAEAAKAAAEKKAAADASRTAAPAQAAIATADKKPAAKAQSSDQDEESMVMIDNKAEIDEGRPAREESEPEERAVPGGLPASYGQCKGVLNEGGRSVLVFESADDGAVTFVQVNLGRGGASWKLLDRIPRSAD